MARGRRRSGSAVNQAVAKATSYVRSSSNPWWNVAGTGPKSSSTTRSAEAASV